MGFNCGIVGLPNVGKSTIFSAITAAPAEAANYPFCTIEPNVGIVNVSDERLQKISEIIGPEKIIPTVVEFVDIAGLVKGASKGEGLGNQFLGHVRQVSAIAHIVRCFEDSDVVHVSGRVDPIEDIEIINLELALADLEVVERKIGNNEKLVKSHDKKISTNAKIAKPILIELQKCLSEGNLASSLNLDEIALAAIQDLNLITLKKVIYVCNIDEESIHEDNENVKQVKEYATKNGSEVLKICGKLESEIASLETAEEKHEFLEAAGISESGLDQLTNKAYKLLDLRTYFTAGVKEVRAWTFPDGALAPEAAGVIHTDFEKGFIKAEVFHYEDLINFGSEAGVKSNGKLRMEGKEYLVKDGDIIHFRFNV
jgi:ribosome-binding ATPase